MSDTEIIEPEFVESHELVVRETRTPSRIEGGMAHFDQYLMLAERICKTAMVPTQLRNRPDEVLAVVMYGAELGIGPMQALQQINFIEGKPGMTPELMRALIREAGHKLSISLSRTRCVIEGERGDTGETGEAEFTVEDAVDAGLCSVDQDGRVRARSQQGKPLSWEKYTKDMLLARATSRIARMMFSDVVAGMSYIPEEIESFMTPEAQKVKRATRKSQGTPTTKRRPPVNDDRAPASPEMFEKLKTAFGMLAEEDTQSVTETFAEHGLPKRMNEWDDEQINAALDIIDGVLNATLGASDEETSEPPLGKTVLEHVGPESIRVGADDILPPYAPKNKITQLNIRFAESGFKDRDEIHAYAAKVVGINDVDTLNHLTKPMVDKILQQLIADFDQ